jgi:DUF1680 family protein
MEGRLARRDFLKGAPAMAALAYSAPAHGAAEPAAQKPAPRISAQSWKPSDYPLRAKRFAEVTLRDDFWAPKMRTNAEVTIPFEMQKARESGRGLSRNILEAAIYSLQTHPNAAVQAEVEARVEALTTAARESQGLPGNSGFEVAVAWYHATGKRDLLDVATQAAAALYEDFRVNNPPFSGGERDATNCLQLYRVTRDRKHLDLAKHYLDIRGLENSVNRSRHNQSYKPVLEQTEAVGHAVNAVTLMVSLADTGMFTGLDAYFDAAQQMWQDAVTSKLYVTGGVGTTGNEGFGEPYSLPNISAYSETCAVLMFITLSHRLFLATGDSAYIDVMERGMYNNALSGVSAAGNRYFYVNRLSSAGDGRDHRWERASLECCPPNLVRFLASMPGYVYAQDARDAIYVNLYVSSEATFDVRGGKLTLSVESELPWDGRSAITVATPEPARAALKLRIPGWARNRPVPGNLYAYTDRIARQVTISVNGANVNVAPDRRGYVTIERTWQQGDVVRIEFPVEVRRMVADTRVPENRGRMAVERGPIVYCAEWPDCEAAHVLDLRIEPDAPLRPVTDPAFYGGVTVIDTMARSLTNPATSPSRVRLIPYHLWANRGTGEMTVWLPTRDYVPGDVGPAGGWIFYENPNHAADGWRYLEAAPFDQSAGAPWGCFRRAIEGARGTAVGTGRQNTKDMLAACTEPGTAAYLCANLSVNGVTDWFLPSRDELTLMYRNLKAAGVSDFGICNVTDNFTYWASSQQTADMAVHVDIADLGRVHGDDKDFPRRVRAIRAF